MDNEINTVQPASPTPNSHKKLKIGLILFALILALGIGSYVLTGGELFKGLMMSQTEQKPAPAIPIISETQPVESLTDWDSFISKFKQGNQNLVDSFGNHDIVIGNGPVLLKTKLLHAVCINTGAAGIVDTLTFIPAANYHGITDFFPAVRLRSGDSVSFNPISAGTITLREGPPFGNCTGSENLLGTFNIVEAVIPAAYTLSAGPSSINEIGTSSETTTTITLTALNNPSISSTTLELSCANCKASVDGSTFEATPITKTVSLTGTENIKTGTVTVQAQVDSDDTDGQLIVNKTAAQQGNPPLATITISVIDNDIDVIPPVITLLGDDPMTLIVGNTYTEPGATAMDDVDGDITANIQVTGTVNTAVAGTYSITYTVSDFAGNETMETRTVNVVPAPVFTTLTLSLNPSTIYEGAGSPEKPNTSTIKVTSSTTVTLVGGLNIPVTYISPNGNGGFNQFTQTLNIPQNEIEQSMMVTSVSDSNANDEIIYLNAGAVTGYNLAPPVIHDPLGAIPDYQLSLSIKDNAPTPASITIPVLNAQIAGSANVVFNESFLKFADDTASANIKFMDTATPPAQAGTITSPSYNLGTKILSFSYTGLKYNKNYNLVIPADTFCVTGVEGACLNNLANEFKFAFATQEQPIIASVTPSGANVANTPGDITIVFSGSGLNALTYNANKAVTLVSSGNPSVIVTVTHASFDPVTATLVEHYPELTANTTYTIQIPEGIVQTADGAPSQASADLSVPLTFTTAAPGAPTLTAKSPSGLTKISAGTFTAATTTFSGTALTCISPTPQATITKDSLTGIALASTTTCAVAADAATATITVTLAGGVTLNNDSIYFVSLPAIVNAGTTSSSATNWNFATQALKPDRGTYSPLDNAVIQVASGIAEITFTGNDLAFRGTPLTPLVAMHTGIKTDTAGDSVAITVTHVDTLDTTTGKITSMKVQIHYPTLLNGTDYTIALSQGLVANGKDHDRPSDAFAWNFKTIASTEIGIVSHFPATSATNIPVSATAATITFNYPGILSLHNYDVKMVKSGTNVDMASGSTSVTLAPDPFTPNNYILSISYSTLEEGSVYYITIPRGIVYNGTKFAPTVDYTWYFTTVSVNDEIKITGIKAGPTGFSPKDSERTKITFNTNQTAKLTITVENDDGEEVRKFSAYDNDEYSSGGQSVYWNGKDDDSKVVKDGTYTVLVEAQNSRGTDSDSVEVEVDSNGAGGGGDDVTSLFDDLDNVDNEMVDAIQFVYDSEIMKGYNDDTFRPKQKINRAELAKILKIAFDLPGAPDEDLNFSDVEVNSWYYTYLQTMVSEGIMSGDRGKDTIRPQEFTNRVEAAKMFAQATGENITSCRETPYTDVKIQDWFSKYVCYFKEYELLDSISGSKFGVAAYLTRGEAALILMRMYDQGLL